MKKGNAKAIYLKDYSPPPFLVERVDLCFRMDEDACLVHSLLRVKRNPAASRAVNFELDGHGLELVSLQMDGQVVLKTRYRLDDSGLCILSVPDHFSLEVT